MFCDIVDNHKKSFGVGNMKKSFQPVNHSLTSPHHSILHRQPKARLKPRLEIERSKFKKRQKTIPACTFCKEQGHRTTNCEKRSVLQNSGTEYTLCNDDRCVVYLRSLIEDLEYHSCLQQMNFEWTTMDGIDTRYGYKNLIIEKAYSLQNRIYGQKVPISSMFFSIKFLDKNANIVEEEEATIITGSKLKFYCEKAFEKKHPTYIYNRCSMITKNLGTESLQLLNEQHSYMIENNDGLTQENFIDEGMGSSMYPYTYQTNHRSYNDPIGYGGEQSIDENYCEKIELLNYDYC